jgi:hypothetical protein
MSVRNGTGGDPAEARGYLSSAAAFAGITALWAVIVRTDPYYRLIDLFGARVPAAMIAYLVLMPLAGFLIGRWRYQAHNGAFAGLAPKLVARFIHFTYVHLLIVLFTVAMATDYFLGLNIDNQIRAIDDRMFDLAARFAPWLAAYLAGYNLGRALRSPAPGDAPELKAARSLSGDKRAKQRIEPDMSEDAAPLAPDEDQGDLALAPTSPQSLTASGLPAAPASANDVPGFLPPQDLEKLRPGLHELR